MAAPRKNVDREKLELVYRAGIKSFREMGEMFGISAPRVKQIAIEEGWERDLSEKIKRDAAIKLNASILNTNLNTEAKKHSEKEIVTASVDLVVGIQITQRKDVVIGREIAMSLLQELRETTDNRDLFAQLGELMAAPDDNNNDKLNDLYRRVISMPQRIDGMKKLSDTLKTLIELERKVYGIDGQEEQSNPLAELIKQCSGKSLPIASNG